MNIQFDIEFNLHGKSKKKRKEKSFLEVDKVGQTQGVDPGVLQSFRGGVQSNYLKCMFSIVHETYLFLIKQPVHRGTPLFV